MLPPGFWPEYIVPVMLHNPFRFIIAAPAELIINPNFDNLVSFLIPLNLYIFMFAILSAIYWKVVVDKYEIAGGEDIKKFYADSIYQNISSLER